MKINPAVIMSPEKSRAFLAREREAKRIAKQQRDLAALASHAEQENSSECPELMMAGERLLGHALLSSEAIVDSSVPFKKLCGVYFIISEGQIIYIGQSVDILSRIGLHENHWKFDAYSIVECAKENLDLLESLYIHLFNPPLNGKGSDGNKFAPVSIKKIMMMAGSK